MLKIRLPSSALFAVRVERQILLQCQDAEAHDEHDHVEDEQRDHVALPVLRGAGERSADELEGPGKLTGCARVGASGSIAHFM